MMVTLGNFLFRFRNGLFPILFLVLLIIASPTFPGGSPQWDVAMDVLGFLVALSGQLLRIVTIGYEYIHRGGHDRQIYAGQLVTGGMFSHCRNPLYLGNFLIFVGITIIFNSWTVYLIGIPLAFFIYAAIICAEENYLRKQFGAEYDDYCEQVPRLWPRLRGFSKSIEGMKFSWKRVFFKEYNTTFNWLMATIALLMWEKYVVLGEQATAQIDALKWWFVPVVLFYIIVWSLKKTKKLWA